MCACVTVWLNDLHRGADEACTFKKRTARVSERGKGRAEPGERGEINRRPLPSLFCDDVWSAGGPLCMGGRRWRAGERERMLNSLLTRLIDSVASLYASLSSPHTQFFFFSLCSLPLIVCAERHLESSSNRFPTCCRDTLVTHSMACLPFSLPAIVYLPLVLSANDPVVPIPSGSSASRRILKYNQGVTLLSFYHVASDHMSE